MRKALVIQHVPHEGLGTIAPELRRFGVEAEFVRVFAGQRVPGDANGYSAVIVLGGPMGVYEEAVYPFITDEIRLVERALKAGRHVLGICLGAQVLARAAGARVYRGKQREIGWFDIRLTPEGEGDKLFSSLPGKLNVFHWHGDTFDVPPGGKNLASSELFENQLLRVGTTAYGMQFHLEVTEEMIRQWIDVNHEELHLLEGVVDPARILKESPGNITSLDRYGTLVFSSFFGSMD